MKLRILLLTVFLTCISAYGQSPDQESLKSLVKSLTDAQTAYDGAALDKILTADYIEISPLGEFDPREKVLGFYTPKAKAEAGDVKATLNIVEPLIRSYGDHAVVIVRLDYSIEANGQKMPRRSIRATFVCKREKSGWKVASAQYTGIRPPTPKPN
ncbi:hypothetical protein BH10ACI2_BH10ACI2_20750 [soil metagenome]